MDVLLENKRQHSKIIYKNEYLVAYKDNNILAATPDIIVILDNESFAPINTENLTYGIQASLLTFKAHPIWYTDKALKIVGLGACNLNLTGV